MAYQQNAPNPYDPYHQRCQFDAYQAGQANAFSQYQQQGGPPLPASQSYMQGWQGLQYHGGQTGPPSYSGGWNQYQYSGEHIGQQYHQGAHYHNGNSGIGCAPNGPQCQYPANPNQYGSIAPNQGMQPGYPPANYTKADIRISGAWDEEEPEGWGETIQVTTPRRRARRPSYVQDPTAESWTAEDDRILLNMREGDMPASWAEIIDTLCEKHSEQGARCRYSQLEAAAEVYSVSRRRSVYLDEQRERARWYLEATGPRPLSRGPSGIAGWTRNHRRADEIPLNRGPSGIAGWTRYPRSTYEEPGRKTDVHLGLFEINPRKYTGVYRNW